MSILNNLKTRAFSACLAAITVTVGIGIASLVISSRLAGDLGRTATIAIALRNHTIGDMYHDGLHGLVYVALAAGELGTPQAKVEGELEEIVGKFRSVIAGHKKLDPSDDVKAPLARVETPLNEYIASARRIVGLGFAGRAQAIAALPDLDARFEALENALDMAGALEVFRVSLVDADRLRAERQEIEQRAAVQRRTDINRLTDEFQATVGDIVEKVATSSGGLEAAASTLSRTADQTQTLSSVAANASEDASFNVKTVADAADQLSSSVGEIARRVQESSRIANEAVAQAHATDAHATDARITELSQTAGRIGAVVDLIQAIAAQTNLLALNATIEAARVGEASKGFAVVAAEVKTLATQTAKAAEDIGAQIGAMQTATRDSVSAIRAIGGTIGRISEIAGAIAAAVEEQGAATREIARNVNQAAQGTAQVATNIADVNRGAAETGLASSQMLGSARELSGQSARLKVEVDRFLSTVQAA